MKFGEKVRDLRKKHSLTQDELAQCLGINKRTIIGWERDGRYPRSIEMLEKAIQRMDFAENGTPYILDWSHATQGNASADVARIYLLFSLAGDVSGANTYLDLFCKKSDTAKQYVQKWMPIVAASQSVKGNEKEKELLLSWVDVVDYE